MQLSCRMSRSQEESTSDSLDEGQPCCHATDETFSTLTPFQMMSASQPHSQMMQQTTPSCSTATTSHDMRSLLNSTPCCLLSICECFIVFFFYCRIICNLGYILSVDAVAVVHVVHVVCLWICIFSNVADILAEDSRLLKSDKSSTSSADDIVKMLLEQQGQFYHFFALSVRQSLVSVSVNEKVVRLRSMNINKKQSIE